MEARTGVGKDGNYDGFFLESGRSCSKLERYEEKDYSEAKLESHMM